MLPLPFKRNKIYASWKLDKAPMSVNRGSHFQVRFVWQVWDGQLSPAFKSIRLKAFGGWKVDWVTTQLHARILRGKGVQKKKPDKFTDGNSTSLTFCPTSVYIRAQTHIHIIPYTYTIYASVYHAYASTHVYIYISITHIFFIWYRTQDIIIWF